MGATTGFTLGYAGQTIPAVGLGTILYPWVDAVPTRLAVLESIKADYRHFDSVFTYGFEHLVGEAIVDALHLGLAKSRDELFITTKLWCTFVEGDHVVPAIKMSLKNLQMEYVDMYLIHLPMMLTQKMTKSPVPRDHIMPTDLKSVWAGMEVCQNLGLTKGIGVSNFSCKKLEDLLVFCKIPPAINKVELNPFCRQMELVEFCKAKGGEPQRFCFYRIIKF